MLAASHPTGRFTNPLRYTLGYGPSDSSLRAAPQLARETPMLLKGSGGDSAPRHHYEAIRKDHRRRLGVGPCRADAALLRNSNGGAALTICEGSRPVRHA